MCRRALLHRILLGVAVTAFGVAAAAKSSSAPSNEPQDTASPANQVVRVFVLDTVSPDDATRLLATFGIDAVATVEELGAVVARAPAARMAVAAELLGALDRPRAEVTVDVELFLLDAASRALLADGDGKLPHRLDAAERTRLREVAPRLLEPRVSLLDRKVGEIHLIQDLAFLVEGSAADARLGVSVRLRPQVEADDDALTLGVAVAVWDIGREAEETAAAGLGRELRELEKAETKRLAVSSHEIRSSVRLRSGETWLVPGLVTSGDDAPTVLATLLFGSAVTASDEIVLVLTPRIVRGRGLSTPDLDRLCADGVVLRDLCWSPDE